MTSHGLADDGHSFRSRRRLFTRQLAPTATTTMTTPTTQFHGRVPEAGAHAEVDNEVDGRVGDLADMGHCLDHHKQVAVLACNTAIT